MRLNVTHHEAERLATACHAMAGHPWKSVKSNKRKARPDRFLVLDYKKILKYTKLADKIENQIDRREPYDN